MAQRSDGIGALPAANDVQRALLARETGSYVMTPAGPVPADAGPTEAQTLNFLGAMTGAGGYADMLGQYPQMPAEDVTVAEMLQGPPGPSLAENLREGEYLDATLQSLGGIPLFGAVARAARGAKVAKAIPEGIDAYHGSGKAFKKFDASKIGTGEGAQAYGYGLYFAEAEKVARGYRDRMMQYAEPPKDSLAAKYYDQYWSPEWDYAKQYSEAPAFIEKIKPDIEATYYDLQTGFTSHRLKDGSVIQQSDYGKIIPSGPLEGALYKVSIKAEPEELLDWDKPFAQQSEQVQKAVSDIFEERQELLRNLPEDYLNANANLSKFLRAPFKGRVGTYRTKEEILADINGQTLYEKAPSTKAYKKWAQEQLWTGQLEPDEVDLPSSISKFFESRGIKGIRYRDGFSRGKEGGTSNFVVFDPQIIEISKRYGIALPLAGAILMGTMTPEEAMAAQEPRSADQGTGGIDALPVGQEVQRTMDQIR